jgi:hypothetical protein
MEHCCNDTDRVNRSTRIKQSQRHSAYTTNTTWTGLELNPDRRGEIPPTNRLSHVYNTTVSCILMRQARARFEVLLMTTVKFTVFWVVTS